MGGLFFDEDGFHRTGFRSLFALLFELFGHLFHFGYGNIPVHFGNVRANLHTRLIPNTSFFIDP